MNAAKAERIIRDAGVPWGIDLDVMERDGTIRVVAHYGIDRPGFDGRRFFKQFLFTPEMEMAGFDIRRDWYELLSVVLRTTSQWVSEQRIALRTEQCRQQGATP